MRASADAGADEVADTPAEFETIFLSEVLPRWLARPVLAVVLVAFLLDGITPSPTP